jgi:hypothetical protein
MIAVSRDQHWSAAVFYEAESIYHRDFVVEAP